MVFLCDMHVSEIETGRWWNKLVDERIYTVCGSGYVENEFYFTFMYDNIRAICLQHLTLVVWHQ